MPRVNSKCSSGGEGGNWIRPTCDLNLHSPSTVTGTVTQALGPGYVSYVPVHGTASASGRSVALSRQSQREVTMDPAVHTAERPASGLL